MTDRLHELDLTYADAHNVTDPAEADQLMWGQVAADSGFRVMAFDVPAARPFSRGQDPVFVSVRADDAEELQRYWQGLSQGATVKTPLGPSGFSPLYGMLTDRFGITWVMDVAAQQAAGGRNRCRWVGAARRARRRCRAGSLSAYTASLRASISPSPARGCAASGFTWSRV